MKESSEELDVSLVERESCFIVHEKKMASFTSYSQPNVPIKVFQCLLSVLLAISRIQNAMYRSVSMVQNRAGMGTKKALILCRASV